MFVNKASKEKLFVLIPPILNRLCCWKTNNEKAYDTRHYILSANFFIAAILIIDKEKLAISAAQLNL